VPAEALLKESTAEDAQKVVELAGNLQELVVAGELLNDIEEVQKEDVACSDVSTSEADASRATRGNTDSHNISENVIEVESSSISTSNTNYVSTSSDVDDIPLNRVYENLHKSLAPSSSTKHQKKPNDDTFVPMYLSILDRIAHMSQMRIDICNRLPANHLLQPPMVEPLQTIPVDAEIGSEQAEPEYDNHVSSLSQPQPTTQTSDPSILEELANHYSDELPGFEPNLERASEIASEEVVSESPQQQEPNSQMASNTCSELIIHPEFQPYHLNATHSNISFGIALRNLANKKSSTHKSPASDINPSLSKESTFIVQPLSVALPSDATLESQTSHENFTRPDFMITSVSDDEDEQANQWFRLGFLNQPLCTSSLFVLEYIHDPPYIAPSKPISKTSIIDTPCSFNQTCPQIITTVVSQPPTLLLDSIILQEVCENIFKDLNKVVKTRNNFVHKEDYVNEWARLRERVDIVMCELQKTSLEACDKALNTLNECFTEVVKNMEKSIC